MKLPKRSLPEGASPVSTGSDLRGPGSYTAQARYKPEALREYIAEALDPETGIRSDIEPRAFLEAAADTTIISYPKSGKTWLAFLASRYIAGYLGFSELFEGLIGGEAGLRTFAPEARRAYLGQVAARRTERRWAPLIRFVHLDSLGYPYFAPKTLGAPATARHVLLVRDPRDILVSHYHHIASKNQGVFDAHRDKPAIAKDFEIGEFLRSDFFGIRHVLAYYSGWGRWAESVNAAVFHYEDFVSDPEGALALFLKEIGVSSVDDDLVTRSVDAASFDRLRAAESNAKLGRGQADDPLTRRMRRGKVSGFVDEMSGEDAVYLARIMERADVPILRRYLDRGG